jgi:hypothetical protein
MDSIVFDLALGIDISVSTMRKVEMSIASFIEDDKGYQRLFLDYPNSTQKCRSSGDVA